MNIDKQSVYINSKKIEENHLMSLLSKGKFFLKETFDLFYKEPDAKFYIAELSGDIEQMKEALSDIEGIDKIDICFTSKRDCLTLLMDKGFESYDNLPYVMMQYPRKHLVFKLYGHDGDRYHFCIEPMEQHNKIDNRYVFKTIQRLIDILTTIKEV